MIFGDDRFIRSHPIILKKWNPDVNLLKEDVGNVIVWVKLHGVPVTAFSEDGLSAIATKIGTPIMLDSYTADIETKNPKKTSQAPKGFLVGHKMAFKSNQEYRPVTKKHTANSSDGYQWGTSNLDKNRANSSRYSFWNVKNSSTGTTPIMDKIGKFEDLIIDGQATLVDEAGNPLEKVDYPGDHDSEDVVAQVDNDMARSLASERTKFGT
ncbi:ribonuclease H-like domain, reverse transcriptase, RNA-dependent DNA polymerase [Tanacetum coccineum]